MKKNFILYLIVLLGSFSQSIYASAVKNNFFVKGVYETEGMRLKYSGVVKFYVSSETENLNDLTLNFQLASFFIEEVVYKDKTYRNHDLFGYSLPLEVIAEIETTSRLTYKEALLDFNTTIKSLSETTYKLNSSESKIIKKVKGIDYVSLLTGLGFRFKILKLIDVKLLQHEGLLVKKLKKALDENDEVKTKEELEAEATRLLAEGNIYLSENNYAQALDSYLISKIYTSDPSFVNDKIDIVDSYLNKAKSKFRWNKKNEASTLNIKSKLNASLPINLEKDFKTPADKISYTDYVAEANVHLGKNEYNEAITKYEKAKEVTTNKAAVTNQIEVIKKFKEKSEKLSDDGSKKRKKKRNSKSKREKLAIKKPQRKSVTKTEKVRKEASEYIVDKDLGYVELLKLGGELLKNKEYIKSKKVFEEARKKTAKTEIVDNILNSVNKLAESETKRNDDAYRKESLANANNRAETRSGSEKTNRSSRVSKNELDTNKIVNTDSAVVLANEEISKSAITGVKSVALRSASSTSSPDLESKNITGFSGIIEEAGGDFELLRTRRGYIKYSRDEQAVVDSNGDIMIPFGKYEIVRFRAGFAKIKLKDSVALKEIECVGKNEEYSWSARIYQNPWQETVIDENSEYVDEVVKKVEIYVVDNVSLLPYDQIPKEIIEAYKDPNQYTGSDFTSAYNLWERDHANDPDVLYARNEIKKFKESTKIEAYQSADRCREEVAKSVQEVYNYFSGLGYEIIIK